MPDKRRVLLNAVMSTVQVAVNGAVFLVLYRFLLDVIGENQAGVWALVLSWTAAISVADLGMAGGAVKFVSRHLARGDKGRVVHVVQTSILSVALILLVVLILVYPLLAEGLRLIVKPAAHIPDALAVLPYAVISFWLTSVAGVIQSCIDGTQRVYVRNALVMGSAALYLGLALLLVPGGGLIGLAQAQVIQAAAILIAAWIALKYLIPELPHLPLRWNKSVFREMFGYSVNFQFVSVAHFLFQPLAKSLISIFGGVGPVFFFEMAHKLVVQLRALIVMAHQSLVPLLAHLQETRAERVQEIYRVSFRLLVFLVAAALPFLVGMTPVISRLWIGAYEPTFITYATLLFVGWFVNILSSPAYFNYLGIGRLRWIVVGHVIIGVLNGTLGLVLGYSFGPTGAVVAYCSAILLGSMVTLLAYHREYFVHWSELLDRYTLTLGLSSAAGLGMVLYLDHLLRDVISPLGMAAVLVFSYLAVITWAVWTHPVRRLLQGWVLRALDRPENFPHTPLSS